MTIRSYRSVMVIIVAFLALCVTACVLPLPLPPATGVLEVDIVYTGAFYRETFDYAPDAPHFRHFVLVVPAADAPDQGAGWAFTSLELQPDGVTIRKDRENFAWALDYLHEAPSAHFSGRFPPADYLLAGAFITGPVSREEAGVGEDVVLWPGVTGGGASTPFQTVSIIADETTRVTLQMTDQDGWACPWLYIFDGVRYVRHSEILRNLRGQSSAQPEITPLSPAYIVGGAILVRISEEREEVTYLDAVWLQSGDMRIGPISEPGPEAPLAKVDERYVILRSGEQLDLRFELPPGLQAGDEMSLVAAAFYVPTP